MKYKTISANNISLLEVDNENGLKVVFSPVGASIKSIVFNDKEMLVAPKRSVNFISNNYLVGRTINPLEEDIKNESGLSYKLPYFLFKSNPNLNKKYFSILYTFEKKKNKDGILNDIKYFVAYSLSEASNEILIDYRAASDVDSEISMSNNLIYCLGSEDVNDLHLSISTNENKEIYINNNKIINIENDDYILEIAPTDYECVNITTYRINDEGTEKKGIKVSPIDNPSKINITKKAMFYHREILLRFIKK